MPPEESTTPDEDRHLIPLGSKLAKAMKLRADGKTDSARTLLREILLADPRLAEPRLELAHIAADGEEWEEAEEQARAALELLLKGGQWTADVSQESLRSFATNLLAEVIYRAIQAGDLIFRDEKAFKARWNEAAELFEQALKLDPQNEDARYWVNHVKAT
ncbi:MAG: hypothetical protein KDA24_26835 [Deltaproteobacteria bacterium]|nr:hypothetical protein [Deltaproteobacteria bacterium]